MITVTGLLIRAQSWRRLLLLAGCGAAATTVLLIVISLLLLPAEPTEFLFAVVADPSTRGGVVLALLLLLAPVLVLAYQVVLLGSTTRTRHLAVLHVTGATPAQLRVLGGAVPALPAGAGAVLGVPGYFALRAAMGGTTGYVLQPTVDSVPVIALQLIPTSVTPAVWQMAAVVVAVTVGVGVMGWRVTRSATAGALPSIRQLPRRRPRPWGLVLALIGLAVFIGSLDHTENVAVLLGLTALVAVGLMVSGPWIAYRAGTFIARRASSVSTMLGSSRLVYDPWSAGRAAAPIAIIGFVAGGTGVIVTELVVERIAEAFYLISILLVALLLLLALIFVAFAIAAQSVETLAEHRRPIAAIVASGLSGVQLERSLKVEALLVAWPSVTAGVLLSSLPLLGFAHFQYSYDEDGPTSAGLIVSVGLIATLIVLVATLAITRIAVAAALVLVRPWIHVATVADNLRTE